ncbi:MAG: pyridoxal phosphate-dependent aminotransferase [Synergistaceae bacterium]|jgi:aminotransferase|nr:pyridoxal phosphate-dependent aminotransferase [Synergistaceae bacterium]
MSENRIASRVCLLESSPIRRIATIAQDLISQGIDICNLTIGRPDFDTPAHIKKAAIDAMEQGKVHYSPTSGEKVFREAVSHRLKADDGVYYSPDEIIATMGGGEGGYAVLASLVNPGDEVIVASPMYPYYKGWTSLCGGTLVSLPLTGKEFEVDIERLKKIITPKSRVLILTSPHNPTGKIWKRPVLENIAQICAKHDITVLYDNIYSSFVYEGNKAFNIASLDGMKERTVIVASFSKTYAMDGWRIGYIAAPRSLIEGITKMHQHLVSCANTFVQIAAAHALEASQDCVEDIRQEFDRRRKMVMKYMDEMGLSCPRPEGSFFVFPSIEKYGMTSLDFAHFLIEKAHVATVPGSAFGEGGEYHVRLAYTISCDLMQPGLERMKTCLLSLEK